MAAENVTAFFNRAKTDPKLQSQMSAVSRADRKAAAAQIVTIAKSAGYEFTADELAAAHQKAAGGRELSDSELSAVAGGFSIGWD